VEKGEFPIYRAKPSYTLTSIQMHFYVRRTSAWLAIIILRIVEREEKGEREEEYF